MIEQSGRTLARTAPNLPFLDRISRDRDLRVETLCTVVLLSLGSAVLLWAILGFFEPANLDNDVAQHLSGAGNLLSGRGLTTSLLFYD